MKRFSNWTSLFLLGGLMLTAAATRANADAWNKKTYVTINRAIEVPGAVLQPGKYVFKLVDSASNRHIVQIMNADENRVMATDLAIPKQRDTPASKTVLTFYEMPGGGPEPIRAWYYPGDTIGQEFLYSRDRAAQIAQATRLDVPVLAQAEPAPTTVAATSEAAVAPSSTPVTEGANQNQSVALNSEPAPNTATDTTADAVEPAPLEPAPYTEPEASQEPAPATPAPATPAPAPAMPQTASNLFAVGILGLGCLGLATVLGTSRRRREQ